MVVSGVSLGAEQVIHIPGNPARLQILFPSAGDDCHLRQRQEGGCEQEYERAQGIDIVGDEVYHNKLNIPRRLSVSRVQTAAVLAVAPGRSVSGASASSSVPRPVYLKPTIFYLGGEIEHR